MNTHIKFPFPFLATKLLVNVGWDPFCTFCVVQYTRNTQQDSTAYEKRFCSHTHTHTHRTRHYFSSSSCSAITPLRRFLFSYIVDAKMFFIKINFSFCLLLFAKKKKKLFCSFGHHTNTQWIFVAFLLSTSGPHHIQNKIYISSFFYLKMNLVFIKIRWRVHNFNRSSHNGICLCIHIGGGGAGSKFIHSFSLVHFGYCCCCWPLFLCAHISTYLISKIYIFRWCWHLNKKTQFAALTVTTKQNGFPGDNATMMMVRFFFICVHFIRSIPLLLSRLCKHKEKLFKLFINFECIIYIILW